MAAIKHGSSIDMQKNEVQNLRLQNLAADPGSPVEGIVFGHTGDHVIHYWNGSAWIALGRLDQITVPAADVSLNSHKLTNVQDAVSAQDAVTFGQVSAMFAAISSGLSWKDSVKTATFTNGTLASAFEAGDTVGGVVLSVGDRFLLGGQTAGADNGIYTANASGAPTRATDADTAADLQGAFVPVDQGTYGSKVFYLATDNITLGVTAQVWSEFQSAPTKYAADIGDGSTTAIVVTHSLNDLDVNVTVYDKSSGAEVRVDTVHTSANVVTLNFTVAPTTAQYRVVVHA